MKILIAGANGQIGSKIVKMLSKSDHQVRAMVRDSKQVDKMLKLGADETVVADLEGNLKEAVAGCTGIIFTAGSGSHTGRDKTELVDKEGAKKLVDEALKEDIERFIIVSSRHADKPEKAPDKIRYYFEAKGEADEYLRSSGLNYTVIRPGGLINGDGSGLILAKESLDEDEKSGNIPREDVAMTVVSSIDEDKTFHRSFDLVSGDITIREALADL
jgi:uncharacterized protein YbjT (DUF2867 family)